MHRTHATEPDVVGGYVSFETVQFGPSTFLPAATVPLVPTIDTTRSVLR